MHTHTHTHTHTHRHVHTHVSNRSVIGHSSITQNYVTHTHTHTHTHTRTHAHTVTFCFRHDGHIIYSVLAEFPQSAEAHSHPSPCVCVCVCVRIFPNYVINGLLNAQANHHCHELV